MGSNPIWSSEFFSEFPIDVKNPNYQRIIDSYDRLEGVQIRDSDPTQYPTRAPDTSRKRTCSNQFKTSERPRVGLPGEPVAETTKLD